MRTNEEGAGRSRRTVEAAFAEFYQGLVTDLTQVCGGRSGAERAAREAFRRAARTPDFEQIGRPREWLERVARNVVLRRSFQSECLAGTDWPSGGRSWLAEDFRLPHLDHVLAEGRRAHRQRLALAAAAVLGIVVLVGTLVFLGFKIAKAPEASAVPLTSATPSSASPGPAASRPAADDVIRDPGAVAVEKVYAEDGSGMTLTVWKRCGSAGADGQPRHDCRGDDFVLAAEINGRDGPGYSAVLPRRLISIRPLPAGRFLVHAVDRRQVWSNEGVTTLDRRG